MIIKQNLSILFPIPCKIGLFCSQQNTKDVSQSLRTLLSQTAIYGLSSIVGRFLNYLLVPLYTRIFAPAEYGIVSELYAYAGFFSVLLAFGMETAYFRFIHKTGETRPVYPTGLRFITIINLFFFAAVFSGMPVIADWMGYKGMEEYLYCFAGITALEGLSALPMARLRKENRATRFAIIRLSDMGLNIILNLVFYLVLNREGIIWIFYANLAASFLRFLLLLPQYVPVFEKSDRQLLAEMVRYAWPVLIIGFAGVINEMMDRMVLKFWLPYDPQTNLAQLGIYSACYKLSILMTLFIQAYRYAAEPFFFSHSEKEDAKKLYAQALHAFVVIALTGFLGVTLFMPWLKYFIGPLYHGGLHIVPVLLLANIFLGVTVNLSIWYKITDRTSAGMYIALLGGLVTAGINYLLIPKLGYAAAAWTTFLCYLLMAAVSYAAGQRYYPVPYNIRLMGGFMFLSIGLFALSFSIRKYIPLSGQADFCLSMGLLIIYLLIVWKFRRKILG